LTKQEARRTHRSFLAKDLLPFFIALSATLGPFQPMISSFLPVPATMPSGQTRREKQKKSNRREHGLLLLLLLTRVCIGDQKELREM
jgi:hypothetical protein